eukprot:CAMPEP_0204828008 /NCGR_PEP_ID=MMETSP1346-20131115/5575_1 /ASSEMBLY_ACC=CAM_ASM_000771 /TAXON_ID=215587 /ORGANISM="Aplanochytrium stocchinoi, Strain GSBS06" /LENGTH=32 /DNA_ID= /DNA_START= /DNA_END= /DNA_ORIENTATION=
MEQQEYVKKLISEATGEEDAKPEKLYPVSQAL